MLHFDTKFSIFNFVDKILGLRDAGRQREYHKLTWNQYKSGVKATEAVRNINSRLAQEAVNNRMAKWWFREFRQERQSIKLKTDIKNPPSINRRVLVKSV